MSRQAAADMSWRPIASAPRDGMPVLLYSPDSDEPRIALGLWVVDDWYDFWAAGLAIDAAPSHWMPLPAPPLIRERGDDA
jgi:hypothetical protein